MVSPFPQCNCVSNCSVISQKAYVTTQPMVEKRASAGCKSLPYDVLLRWLAQGAVLHHADMQHFEPTEYHQVKPSATVFAICYNRGKATEHVTSKQTIGG